MATTPEQRRAAADPNTPGVVLAQLAAIPELQITIAANPTTSEDVLDWLLEHGSNETRAALGEDVRPTDLPPATLQRPEVEADQLWARGLRMSPRSGGRPRVEADEFWAQEQAYRREREAKVADPQGYRDRQVAERAAAATARDAKELADRAGEIRRWEAAWALAHDGQAPPSGFLPPVAVMSRGGYGAKSTNSMAIAAFVSVLFVAILGLILGNIALRQIRDSGEGGHGLALAAVVIG